MLAKFASLVFRVRSLLAGRTFRRFFAKPECKPAAYRPLPNPLPQGEGTNWPETPKMVGFQHPQSSLPRREGIKLAGNPKHGWVSVSSILSPRGRGLGRGQRTVRFAFYRSSVLQKLCPKTPNLFKNGKRSSRQEAARSENKQNEFR